MAMNRRQFLTSAVRAGALAALPSIVPASVLGRGGAVAPGDRITMGVIGIGPRCRTVLNSILDEPDLRVVTICDVQKSRRDGGKQMIDQKYGDTGCTTCADFRELIARPDVDALLIATGDHWHALASILAMRAGKDVYSEKPCAMTIEDCQLLDATARRTGRVFQAGTQRRSIGNFQTAIHLARSGKLGRIHTMHASIYRPQCRRDWLPEEPLPPRDEVDWDLWLGPCPWRPYNQEYVRGGWRRHYDFDSGGTLLDWGAHTVDLCQMANGADDTVPVEYVPGPEGITCRYANGVKLILDYLDSPFGNRAPKYITELGTCPVRFVGDEGWIETGDNGGIEVSSATLKRELRTLRTGLVGTNPGSHGRNFLDCMKSRLPTQANTGVMRHSHVACHAAALAWELNRTMRFDPQTERFLDDDEANRCRSRAKRAPWIA